ncbi:MAG TPA: hypothetical protein VGP18_13315 [Solirubrobacteraceae bacterium]|nr:hypothetical protein [Solirubrobacteraceae bacterium]
MSANSLGDYLARPMSEPEQQTLAAIGRGPIDPRNALALSAMDRLLDPALLPCETGWCVLPDGVAYVAVRTAMPNVSAKMIDWWFDWHPRDPLRYRVWHPIAHLDNSLQPASLPRAKGHWGAVHHPVEDVGTGVVHARIEFKAPTEMGMSSDALDDPRVASIVCGYAGDDRLHVRHSPMFHVFLREGNGVVLRSRFWLGASLRPYGPLGGLLKPLLNTPLVRGRALPKHLPQALATHCAEEYANLGTLLPELYERFGPAAPSGR